MNPKLDKSHKDVALLSNSSPRECRGCYQIEKANCYCFLRLKTFISPFSGYKFAPSDLDGHPVNTYHRIIEAFKFAYKYRSMLSDPDYEKDVNKVNAFTAQNNWDSRILVWNKKFEKWSMATLHDLVHKTNKTLEHEKDKQEGGVRVCGHVVLP